MFDQGFENPSAQTGRRRVDTAASIWHVKWRSFVGAVLLCACASQSAGPATQGGAGRGEPIYFSYGTTEGTEFSSETTRGRATAILFVTTFDLASQAEARHLNDVLRTHRPRINAGVVVLEAPKYATFAEVFRTSLGLNYPVAIADAGTLLGEGPFGSVDRVPTLIVLDSYGREGSRLIGLRKPSEIESALEGVQQGKP